MDKNIANSIGKKLEISITTAMFLSVIIKTFFDISTPAKSNTLFIAFSVFVGIQIINYGLFCFLGKIVDGLRSKIIEFLLKINFFLVGLMSIFTLFSLELDRLDPIMQWVTQNLGGWILALFWISPLIIFLLFLSFLLPNNPTKENKLKKVVKETKMVGGIWKRVLLFLYNNESNWTFFSKGKKGQIDNNHPITKSLKITPFSLAASLAMLVRQKLIYEEKGDGKWFILTDKGFNTALELEKHNGQCFLQFGLIAFTAMLFMNGTVSIILKISKPNPLHLLLAYFLFVIGMVAIIFARKRKFFI